VLRIVLAAGLAGLIASAAVAQPEPTQQISEPSAPSGVPAATDPGANVTTPVDRNADPDKVICKTVKPVTGTRVSSARSRTKVCMTKQQWDDQAREAQEQLNQRNRGVCSGSNCAG